MNYLPMIFLFSVLNFYRNDYNVKKANSHYRQIGNCRKKRVWLTFFEILLWVQQCFSVFFYLYHTLLRQILFPILKWGNKIVLYLANNYEFSEWKSVIKHQICGTMLFSLPILLRALHLPSLPSGSPDLKDWS